MDGIQYIINEEGEKKAVIIDLEKWGNLWQELSEKILKSSDQIEEKKREWHDFIEQTYGCLADDPIVRHSQGEYIQRETLE
ncbi:hypothetical protein [Geminocystis herdmanii]|uniref:hypothetical protein n=1 Tax=Geminocystis herdmanii TaxID=669359 RepID=UPI00034D4D43|nr:hypothetical protein [Geminocystis herdmanii]